MRENALKCKQKKLLYNNFYLTCISFLLVLVRLQRRDSLGEVIEIIIVPAIKAGCKAIVNFNFYFKFNVNECCTYI